VIPQTFQQKKAPPEVQLHNVTEKNMHIPNVNAQYVCTNSNSIHNNRAGDSYCTYCEHTHAISELLQIMRKLPNFILKLKIRTSV
jgi:hypothetical protein